MTQTIAPDSTSLAEQPIEKVAIDTIRTLSMDAVQAANSGHPGTPMALAPVAYTLWQQFLRFDPAAPIWTNRDRFVLSVGHASTLLYSLLHLAGVRSVNPEYETLGEPSVTLDDLRHFRQLDSKCPGHPEYRWTAGVEATTGPLGTGIATSVGMAMAGLWQAATFNRPGYTLFDYDVYALCGDGCLMEGIGAEAASLAGHQQLSNLCWIYDNNTDHHRGLAPPGLHRGRRRAVHRLRLGGPARRPTPTTPQRWPPLSPRSRRRQGKPTLIIVDSVIGYGAPTKAGTHAAHGEPLGVDEIRGAKRFYGWPEDESFYVPDGVREHFADGIGRTRGRRARGVGGALRPLRRRVSRNWPTSSTGCSAAGCPTTGTPTSPSSPPTRRASPAATPAARC